jgi:processive 1,2-diacylglycerol beta-glucosyltransferase
LFGGLNGTRARGDHNFLAANVEVTGIPIDPVFSQSEPAPVVRRRLGLDPKIPVVLLLSGGFGVGPTVELVRSFGSGAVRCQLAVVAGRNEEMKQQLEQLTRSFVVPAKIYGFVNNVHELMDAADLIISKPGGLTSSEVLAKGKPLMIIDPIPGQEQRNCEYLLESGVAVRLVDIEDAPDRVNALLQDSDRLAQMRTNAQRIAKPRASVEIVREVLRRMS